jgi:hypothetical protein
MANQLTTLTIQLGNSDDKLTQAEWADFVKKVEGYIRSTDYCQIHFSGSSAGNAPWQNYCLVAEVPVGAINDLSYLVAKMAGRYRQESIAFTVGETEFIRPLSETPREQYSG